MFQPFHFWNSKVIAENITIHDVDCADFGCFSPFHLFQCSFKIKNFVSYNNYAFTGGAIYMEGSASKYDKKATYIISNCNI